LNSITAYSKSIALEPKDNERLVSLCGPLNENLRKLEQLSQVEISNNNFNFVLSGSKGAVERMTDVLKSLYNQTRADKALDQDHVHLTLKQKGFSHIKLLQPNGNKLLTQLQTKHSLIKALGKNQQVYLNNILNHDMTFGVGPAGTGKTFLAVACAVHALEQQNIERLILVRPAVEAGEKLGFLPGDFTQKVDPYLRPLYDALYEIMGVERVNKCIDSKVIEVAPIAYMRGRTLNHAFVILDEGQNTTIEQMKMFLTRIGFGSKAVITGDVTQIDLPSNKASGLKHVIKLLNDIPAINFNFFESKDVIRHPMVQLIIDAYAKDANKYKNHD